MVLVQMVSRVITVTRIAEHAVSILIHVMKLLTILLAVTAPCPGTQPCSGNGNCTIEGVCVCYGNWSGSACSNGEDS
jgi:hypothetical protein